MTRVSIQYSNSAGIKVVGNNNVVSELLVLDTDWLGTLDYPPVEIGFGLVTINSTYADSNAGGGGGDSDVPFTTGPVEPSPSPTPTPTPTPSPTPLRMYPRNTCVRFQQHLSFPPPLRFVFHEARNQCSVLVCGDNLRTLMGCSVIYGMSHTDDS